ncbi:CAP domain-containing protein [Alphaproteobacteria bacterium KMM 3653]|uniref:CAP domain-containing protein n=1 Tax=Harenicola maris TaxID=2841044 RepID=A0AAP2CNP6_9RHOB|nr:CAP domain-containing protein [Harenicola maris]
MPFPALVCLNPAAVSTLHGTCLRGRCSFEGNMHAIKKVAAAAALMMMAGVTSAEACARVTVAGGDERINPAKISQVKIDRAINMELNYQRCKLGLSALAVEPRLSAVAYDHANWMAGSKTLSHKSSKRGRKSLRARISKARLNVRRGAENILSTALYQTEGPNGYRVVNRAQCQFATPAGAPIQRHSYTSLAQYAVQLWMNSPSHRVNLFDRRVRMMGSAAGFDPSTPNCGTIYLTQNFAG